MEPQNLQQQLTDDMQHEMSDSLNHSEVEATLENEGNYLELDDNSYADEIESQDINNKDLDNLIGVMPSQKKLQKTCWYDEDGNRICV